jgi:hypothetical protein
MGKEESLRSTRRGNCSVATRSGLKKDPPWVELQNRFERVPEARRYYQGIDG